MINKEDIYKSVCRFNERRSSTLDTNSKESVIMYIKIYIQNNTITATPPSV